MKNLLRNTIYLLYRHYSGGGTKDIPYESALITVSFFIAIHILQIKVLLWGGGITIGETKGERLLFSFSIILSIYILLTVFFRKKEIINVIYEGDLRKGYGGIIIYICISLLVLIILVLKSKSII